MDRPLKIDMAWEWNWPHRAGSWRNIFLLDFYIKDSGDHSPGFHVHWCVLGWQILDFSYYNRHRVDCLEDCNE